MTFAFLHIKGLSFIKDDIKAYILTFIKEVKQVFYLASLSERTQNCVPFCCIVFILQFPFSKLLHRHKMFIAAATSLFWAAEKTKRIQVYNYMRSSHVSAILTSPKSYTYLLQKYLRKCSLKWTCYYNQQRRNFLTSQALELLWLKTREDGDPCSRKQFIQLFLVFLF